LWPHFAAISTRPPACLVLLIASNRIGNKGVAGNHIYSRLMLDSLREDDV
jgi:hypothetical protein